MSKLLAGEEIGLTPFLSIDEDSPMGIFIGHKHGYSHFTLEEFMEESLIDLSPNMRQRYACAFEVMAKQLRTAL